MKYVFFISVLILSACSTPVNQEKVNFEGETILVGKLNWEGLTSDPYGDWFITGYRDHVVDTESLKSITTPIDHLTAQLFLGTWCEDTQMQIPQIFKILDYLKFDINNLDIYGLEKLENADIVGINGEEKEWNVEFVPTLIFYRDGKEIGRITEFPEETFEKDIADILK